MKKSTPILITLVALGGVFSVEAQTSKIPEPSLPGYSGFHSNLGIQEIVEVGVPLSTKRKPTQVKIEDLKQPIDPETGKTSSFPSPSLTPSFENSNRPAVVDLSLIHI